MTTPAPPSTPPRHSPCIGVCQLDAATDVCRGCARTREEIAAWTSLDESAKSEVWARLPERILSLGIRFRLLPWTPPEIAEWVLETLVSRGGTWVAGVPGAVAEFPCHEHATVSAAAIGSTVIGRAENALFRLCIHDRMRAFAFANGAIVLGLPKGRVTLPTASLFTALGRDEGAIDGAHRHEELFDFGLNRRSSRFCVRAGGSLAAKLRAAAGRPWSDVLTELTAELIAENPARVVESQLLRIEVFARSPAPDGRLLAAGDEIPPGLALPEYAAPVALFYPA